MGITVGKYSFPEDMLKDRAKLHALIRIVTRRLHISQEEWDKEVEAAMEELLNSDPDLKRVSREEARTRG